MPPPSPLYGWLCVLHSAADVLQHAARIRAAQVSSSRPRIYGKATRRGEGGGREREHVREEEEEEDQNWLHRHPMSPESFMHQERALELERRGEKLEDKRPNATPHDSKTTPTSSVDRQSSSTTVPTAVPTPSATHHSSLPNQPVKLTAASFEKHASKADVTPEVIEQTSSQVDATPVAALPEVPIAQDETTLDSQIPPQRNLQSSKVPSSRIGRLFHYGGLAASLGYGAASEMLRRSTTSNNASDANGSAAQQGSVMMTERNISRLVSKLSQMRGAALKLGQFMSIQDSHVLPPQVEEVFRRVQDGAHYMPDWQMERVMSNSLGPSWQDHFTSFDRIPFAAASIGQVHSAVLAASSSPTGRDTRVAVKIQFPNIVDSISSDLGYVKMLLTAGRMLPKGLFFDRTIQVMQEELADECDYTREASFLRRYATPQLLGRDKRFKVPWVWDSSTRDVLVMEHVGGVSVGGNVISSLTTQDRNEIASRILELCLRELFQFRVMQTDPNWSNFLWNQKTRQIELVDFGASREYSKEFIDNWLRLLQAAISDDRDACIHWSLKVGYLTGKESEAMLSAHVRSMQLLGTPFRPSTTQPFAFGQGTQWASVTREIREQIPVMVNERLTPPPRETYSLNRKLSGAFLLASRLGAQMDCRALWEEVVGRYAFAP